MSARPRRSEGHAAFLGNKPTPRGRAGSVPVPGPLSRVGATVAQSPRPAPAPGPSRGRVPVGLGRGIGRGVAGHGVTAARGTVERRPSNDPQGFFSISEHGRLTSYFLGSYHQGNLFESTQYEYLEFNGFDDGQLQGKSESISALVFNPGDEYGPVVVWADALDLRPYVPPGSGGRLFVLYHYTDELAFRNIVDARLSVTTVFASLINKRVHFGLGLYCTAKEPSLWTSRIRILLNNYTRSDPLERIEGNQEADNVLRDWGEKAAFCIPILVPEGLAYNVFVRQPPDLELRLRQLCESGGLQDMQPEKGLLGRDHKGRLVHPNRDVWVVRLLDQQQNVTHAHVQTDCIIAIRRKQVESLARGCGSANHPLVAARQLSLSQLLSHRGLLDEALCVVESAVGCNRRNFLEDDPRVLGTENHMASVLHKKGLVREATSLLEIVVPKCIRSLGTEHTITMEATSTLADMYATHLGRPDDAHDMVRDVFDATTNTMGDAYLQTATAASNCASIQKIRGEHDDAMELIELSLLICTKLLGDDHIDTLEKKSSKADLLQIMGNAEEALPLRHELLTKFCQKLGQTHPRSFMEYVGMVNLLATVGQYDHAEQHARHAKACMATVLGTAHPKYREVVEILALLVERKGPLHSQEAEQLRLEVSCAALRPLLNPKQPWEQSRAQPAGGPRRRAPQPQQQHTNNHRFISDGMQEQYRPSEFGEVDKDGLEPYQPSKPSNFVASADDEEDLEDEIEFDPDERQQS